MTRYPHLATRLFNVPLMLHPDKAEIVMAALADRLGIAHLFRGEQLLTMQSSAAAARSDTGGYGDADADFDRPYDLVQGVAVIPIVGTLVQKSDWMDAYSGITGYNALRAAFLTALGDPAARAILLDVDSPGGEVAGCFDLVDTIFAARGTKPIWSVLNEIAYSGGYALASAADRVVLPRTGGCGSVGVICMHTDVSQALSKAGIAVTLIQYGAQKSGRSSMAPLSDAARGRMQADIDTMGELFVSTVARNRRMAVADVRRTASGHLSGRRRRLDRLRRRGRRARRRLPRAARLSLIRRPIDEPDPVDRHEPIATARERRLGARLRASGRPRAGRSRRTAPGADAVGVAGACRQYGRE